MPAQLTIECTACGAKLKLADRSKLGKKIKCPKCSEVFVAATDEDLDDVDNEAVDEDDDQGDDDQGDEEPEDRPLRKKGAVAGGGVKKGAAAKGGKGKKGKAKSSGSNLPLILGGVAGVVVLLGGLIGVLFATGAFGAAKLDPNQIQVNPTPGTGVFSSLLKEQGDPNFVVPAPLDARWLPPDTEFLVRLKVAELWQAPLLQSYTSSPQTEQPLAELKKYTGLEPAQIDSVTLASFGTANWIVKLKYDNDTDAPGAKNRTPPVLAIVRLKANVSEDSLVQSSGGKKQQHQGKSYLEFPAATPVADAFAAYIADPQTVIVSDVPTIQQVIERGPETADRPELRFLDANQHVLIAGLPRPVDAQLLSTAEKAGMDLPTLASQEQQYAQKINGGSLGLKITGGIEALVMVSCKSVDALREMKSEFDAGKTEALAGYQANKATTPQFLVELVDLAVNNLKSVERDQVWQLRTSIPDSAKDKLVQAPSKLLLMAMTSGLVPQTSGPSPFSTFIGPPAEPPPANSPGDSPEVNAPKDDPQN